MIKANSFLVTFLVACSLSFIFLGCKVNKIHMHAFNYYSSKEDKSEDGKYLVLNNGEKVTGEKIKWQAGLLIKDRIQIDDQKFKIEEVRGYREHRTFYGRKGNEYVKRIVHGSRINIYVKFMEVTETNTIVATGRTYTTHRTQTYHYAQKGEDGDLVAFGSQKDIKKLVADCPLSVEMISLSSRQLRKAIKKKGNYLNRIFEIYNNGCQN